MLHHAALDIGPGNDMKFAGCNTALVHGGSILDIRCNMQVAIRIWAVGVWSCRTGQQKASRGWWPRSGATCWGDFATHTSDNRVQLPECCHNTVQDSSHSKMHTCMPTPTTLQHTPQQSESGVSTDRGHSAHTDCDTPHTRHTWESCVAKWGNSPNTT